MINWIDCRCFPTTAMLPVLRSALQELNLTDIECTVIAPDTEWSAIMKKDDEKYKRTTKLIPQDFSFDSEIDIYDNKVGIFTFSQEHPIAVLIEDDTIHATMKTLFGFMAQHGK